MNARRNRAALAALALAALAGCAYLPPVPDSLRPANAPAGASASPADSARAAIPVPGAVPPPAAPVPARTVPNDSTPGADARAVLESIPEPLTAAERAIPVPVAARSATAADSAAHTVADTAAAPSPDESAPAPAPTRPLGEQPGDSVAIAMPDSLEAILANAGAAPRDTAAAAPAPPDPCWRVQFTAPREKATAELKRRAAESLLFVPAVIERASGLYKVRSRECASRAVATALRERARASGFDGAFLFAEKPK